MIPEETIQRVLADTDIVALIGEHLELKRAGTSWRALCPFHNEKSGSFNVNPERQIFHCFGCQAGGDAIKWVQMYDGVEFPDAVKRLAGRLGIHVDEGKDYNPTNRPTRRRRTMKPRDLPSIPELDPGSKEEREALARLRFLQPETIEYAVRNNFVGFCQVENHRSFVITDKVKVNAQARRLDGKPYWGEVKSLTITGSWASWPIGISYVGDHPDILLAEGGPDFLCAMEICCIYGYPWKPVGMFGVSPFHEKSLPFFRGKRVVQVQHNDEAGKDASERWGGQLAPIAGFRVCNFGGRPKTDLNDFIEEFSAADAGAYLTPYFE
jgi:hypothetical protein